MFETIRIFLYNNIALHRWGNHLIAALVTTFFSLHVPAVWAESPLPERLDTRETAKALLAAPIVPQEAQDLANYFLDHTLPKLLADDSRLARQLGYGESMNDTVTLDRALPLLLINRNDVLNYVATKTDLRDVVLDFVSNTNNWRKTEAGELIPKRIVFLIKNESPSESDSYSRSSITLEQSLAGDWRIIQVGAPKLSRAISFETPQQNQFLLHILGLGRQYLGKASAGDPDGGIPLITLTRLFDDQLTRSKAHTQFDPTSKEFIDNLKRLYQELDFPRKLRGQSGQTREPIQTR